MIPSTDVLIIILHLVWLLTSVIAFVIEFNAFSPLVMGQWIGVSTLFCISILYTLFLSFKVSVPAVHKMYNSVKILTFFSA